MIARNACMCVYKHKKLGEPENMLPQESFKIRCSEIASEALPDKFSSG